MDALVEHQILIDDVLAYAVHPMVSAELSVMFYDMTTIRAQGVSEQDGDVRKFGMSKDGGIAGQSMLGLAQTAEGIPFYYVVFEGRTAEVRTLKALLEKVLTRLPIQRLIAVPNRGLLSLGNLGMRATAYDQPRRSNYRIHSGLARQAISQLRRAIGIYQ